MFHFLNYLMFFNQNVETHLLPVLWNVQRLDKVTVK